MRKITELRLDIHEARDYPEEGDIKRLDGETDKQWLDRVFWGRQNSIGSIYYVVSEQDGSYVTSGRLWISPLLVGLKDDLLFEFRPNRNFNEPDGFTQNEMFLYYMLDDSDHNRLKAEAKRRIELIKKYPDYVEAYFWDHRLCWTA